MFVRPHHANAFSNQPILRFDNNKEIDCQIDGNIHWTDPNTIIEWSQMNVHT